MPVYFQKPINALKRAHEFLDVEKPEQAVEVLYDVMKSKNHKQWSKIHEQIMLLYLTLCVDLKRSHTAKEGLYQYKKICGSVNYNSLVTVVEHYLTLAEEKTGKAREESHQATIDDDLDILDVESLLLSAVSGESSQDRSDKEILTPWVRFLWDSYRQCLELLRNNKNVEKLYHKLTQQAFAFCLQYKRKTEFRKLCDILRNHMMQLQKLAQQQPQMSHSVRLDMPDSLALHLETRVCMLDHAVDMELWQEAFKAVEDINNLMKQGAARSPKIMSMYFSRLALVFLKSGAYLYHAATWHRHFKLLKDNRKNLTTEELKKYASIMVVVTLIVPVTPARSPSDQLIVMDASCMLEKQRRLTGLVGLSREPTRASLLRNLSRLNINQLIPPPLQELYNVMEEEFNPLKLKDAIPAAVAYVEADKDLQGCARALEEVAALRIIQQVSQVYESIRMDRLLKLVPFYSEFRIERMLVESAKSIDLEVRIDHSKGVVRFGADHSALHCATDIRDEMRMQKMPSDLLRSQLVNVAVVLQKALNLIQSEKIEESRELQRASVIKTCLMTAKQNHERCLMRQSIIEKMKEKQESLQREQLAEEERLAEQKQTEFYKEQQKKLEEERKEREDRQKEEFLKDIERKAKREQLEQIMKSEAGAKVLEVYSEEELFKLDADELLAKQLELLRKEKEEKRKRLKEQEKKIDYMVRACRITEIPLWKEMIVKEREKNYEIWKKEDHQRIEEEKKKHEAALALRDRLTLITGDAEEFLKEAQKNRAEKYEEQTIEFNKLFENEKMKRMEAKRQEYIQSRKERWFHEKAIFLKKKKERELQEKERKEREAIAENQRKEREAYAEAQRKFDEQARQQREMEERAEKSSARSERQFPRDFPRDGPSREPYRPRFSQASMAGGRMERDGDRKDGKISWRSSDSKFQSSSFGDRSNFGSKPDSYGERRGGYFNSDGPGRMNRAPPSARPNPESFSNWRDKR